MGLGTADRPLPASTAPLTRAAAARLLETCLSERVTLDEAMTRVALYDGLAGADRGFARAMVSAAMRDLGRIDLALAKFVDRPLEALDPDVRALLRIGAAQTWHLGTPDHAAVGETVAAARLLDGARRAGGLINAVLRKATSTPDGLLAWPAEAAWPAWLFDRLSADIGPEAARRLAAAQMAPPYLHLTLRDPTTPLAILEQEPGATRLPGGTISLPGTPVEALDGYGDGTWWVQDAAAALPARVLAVRPDEVVADLCAAPGGKTLQLATSGADIIAVDRAASRLGRLRANLDRTGLADRVRIVTGKVETWRPDKPVDALLLDPPCSALGTLRRHPEGAWIKRADDLTRYPEVQARLLRAAVAQVRPGGRLVYCVCTPLAAEGRDVVESALKAGGLARLPIDPDEVPGFEACLTAEGDLLTIPPPDTGQAALHDAFYIARLQRT